MTSTWEYDLDLPTDKDKVRLLIGDTDPNDPLLSDTEIQYFVDGQGSLGRAASEACRAIAGMFARNMSQSIGGLSADFSAKYRQYLGMADELAASSDQSDTVSPYISGYSKAAKETEHGDSDRETLDAYRGIHDFPSSVTTNYDGT